MSFPSDFLKSPQVKPIAKPVVPHENWCEPVCGECPHYHARDALRAPPEAPKLVGLKADLIVVDDLPAPLSTPVPTEVEPAPEAHDHSRPLMVELGRCGDVWLRIPVTDEWGEPGYNRERATADHQALVNLWPTLVEHDGEWVAQAVAHRFNAGRCVGG